MSSPPRVSIGVPVYNGEKYLSRTLNSLLAQSLGDFELIISDNASTDATGAICAQYASQDSRIRYSRSDVNQGAAWNFNRVAQLATGKYFKWACADDLSAPETLETCIAVLEREADVVLVCGRSAHIDEFDNVIRTVDPGWDLRSDVPRERLRRVIYAGGDWNNADALQGVIRREALLRTTLFPRYQGGDKRPLAELSLIGKFVQLPSPLLLRRMHENASSHNNPAFATDRARALKWTADFFKGSHAQIARPLWSLIRDHLRIIRRSPLRTLDKMALVGTVCKLMRWQWQRLLKELSPV